MEVREFFDLNRLINSGYRNEAWSHLSIVNRIFVLISLKLGLFV